VYKKRESAHAYKQCVHNDKHNTLQLNDNIIIMNETVTEK